MPQQCYVSIKVSKCVFLISELISPRCDDDSGLQTTFGVSLLLQQQALSKNPRGSEYLGANNARVGPGGKPGFESWLPALIAMGLKLFHILTLNSHSCETGIMHFLTGLLRVKDECKG